eukprot:1142222-Pelagomonas_calceolata.AAC.4
MAQQCLCSLGISRTAQRWRVRSKGLHGTAPCVRCERSLQPADHRACHGQSVEQPSKWHAQKSGLPIYTTEGTKTTGCVQSHILFAPSYEHLSYLHLPICTTEGTKTTSCVQATFPSLKECIPYQMLKKTGSIHESQQLRHCALQELFNSTSSCTCNTAKTCCKNKLHELSTCKLTAHEDS